MGFIVVRFYRIVGRSVIFLKEIIMSKILSKGEYSIDAQLNGGSGKVHIKSPAKLTVSDNGKMKAEIEWSSPNYDYMKISDNEYYPENKDGNSVFIIDVPELDKDIPLSAETIAMSKPHMIEYTLHFDSSSAKIENNFGGIIGTVVSVGTLMALLTVIIKKTVMKNEKK